MIPILVQKTENKVIYNKSNLNCKTFFEEFSSIMRQRSWMSLRVNFCRWIYRSVLEVWVIVCWAKVSFLAGTPWRLRISQLQRGSPVLKETWPRLVRFRKPSSRVPLRKCTSWLKRSSTKWRSQKFISNELFHLLFYFILPQSAVNIDVALHCDPKQADIQL